MGISDHLTCLLRNLYAGQEATVRTGHGTRDCFQIGKGVRQGCILSPCLLNLYAEYIMRNAVLFISPSNEYPGLLSFRIDWFYLFAVKVCHSFSFQEQVSFNFMAPVTVRSDFGAQENKIYHCFHVSPYIYHEVMGPGAMIFVF